eukprot:TRINITY_DN48777_c0_g1_i1.p1 TRINITY_DN48777_c0_g1~~TRINITY_DN48777_c0_g1_i1.p1  ORF type:complete len:455 (+),score=44.30 TRINITY_DN48777_c0_g1_i1:107-1471(+)
MAKLWTSHLTLAVLLLTGIDAGFKCGEPWPDYCNGTQNDLIALTESAHSHIPKSRCDAGGTSGCTPYSPPLPAGTDWVDVRRRLVNVLFGVDDGRIPAHRMPVEISKLNHNQVFGNCICAIRGHCSPEACSKRTFVTKLVWTVEVEVNSSFNLSLNSTGFHSLETSGIAPSNDLPFGPPEWPEDPAPPQSPGDTLVIFHNGHEQPCSQDGCDTDHDGVMDWLNRLGYDTLHLQMPLYQCNALDAVPCRHQWFKKFDDQGAPVFRFFLEPVVQAVSYATSVLGYKRIVMAGLSGGGWTTTLMAAIDPRITLSFPIAGSMPCDFKHTSWDFEQYCDSKWAIVANYTSLYVLAGLEPSRYSVQIIHEGDPCCFHACHRHERISDYNSWVQSQIAGRFATVATSGNLHEVNPRDKVIVGAFIEKLRMAGELTAADFSTIPFNLIRKQTKSAEKSTSIV